MMQTIVVASKNPVKIRSAKRGFQRMFPNEVFQMQAVSIPSGVSDQPQSDSETLKGALTRAHGAAFHFEEADFWVGIEGGVEVQNDEMAAFAWVVIKSRDGIGKARSGTFYLPPEVVEQIRQGRELGDADDIIFRRTNSKQESGAIGILTGNVIDRTLLYEHAVILSLLRFKNPGLYDR